MMRARSIAATLILGGTVAACSPAPAEPAKAPEAKTITETYACGALGQVTAQFATFDGLNATVLTLPKGTIAGPLGDRLLLPQAVSASGARFASDRVEFWTKGDEATLTITDGAWPPRVVACRAAG